MLSLVILSGLEPETYCLEGSCSIQLSYRTMKNSRGGRIRTYDLHIPNVARYRATLHPELSQSTPENPLDFIVIPLGLEPRTLTLKVLCSTS
jgi:hypothetical protein